MANLLDTIRKNNASMLEPQGVTDESRGLQRLLRAKSGKSTQGDTGAGMSTLGEEQAVANTNTQLQQAGVGAATQANQQQVASQAAAGKERDVANEIEQARRLDTVQTRVQTDKLLGELERNKGEIDTNRSNASLEQLGFNLRMQNKEYVDNLQREGAKARLDNSVSFEEMLQKDIFGENERMLQEKLKNKSILNENERIFQREMTHMTIDQAWESMYNEMKQEKIRKQWETFGKMTSAGGGAASAGGGGGGGQTTPGGDYSGSDTSFYGDSGSGGGSVA